VGTVKCPSIVLTGGPGGGKTTLMGELRAEDPHAQRWIMVPEAAPLLFRGGLDGRLKEFQKAVVRLQIALEDACAEAARPGQGLICHRGTLDALAYWLRNGWDDSEFFAFMQTDCTDQLRRYAAVIHLQTAAIGAEAFYRRWPNAHRLETLAQAAEIDQLCGRVWSKHRHCVVIENAGREWRNKSLAAQTVLARCLALDNE
jgi:hypothetical protein